MSVSYEEMDEYYASIRPPKRRCNRLRPDCSECDDYKCRRRDEEEEEEGGDNE